MSKPQKGRFRQITPSIKSKARTSKPFWYGVPGKKMANPNHFQIELHLGYLWASDGILFEDNKNDSYDQNLLEIDDVKILIKESVEWLGV